MSQLGRNDVTPVQKYNKERKGIRNGICHLFRLRHQTLAHYY